MALKPYNEALANYLDAYPKPHARISEPRYGIPYPHKRAFDKHELPSGFGRSPFSNAVQHILDGVRDVFQRLNLANQTLLGIGPRLDTMEKTINSLLQLAGGDTELVLFLSDFIRSFRKLDVGGVWGKFGEVFTNFSSRMNSLSSGVDILSKKIWVFY